MKFAAQLAAIRQVSPRVLAASQYWLACSVNVGSIPSNLYYSRGRHKIASLRREVVTGNYGLSLAAFSRLAKTSAFSCLLIRIHTLGATLFMAS